MRRRRLAAALVAAALAIAAVSPAAEPRPVEPAWCASELETLSDGTCSYEPSADETPVSAGKGVRAPPDTLVIFLHTLVKAGSSWQWEQQRTMWTAATRHGFSLLVPRGRPGIGPGRAPDVVAWPTATKAQALLEDELLDEWQRARAELEARRGRPFRRVWIFGFSNGAYYATSLALRGKLPVSGYGVFAGGAGGKYHRIVGAKAKHRAPLFVGFGTRDPAHHDMRELLSTLKTLGWSFGSTSQPVGHIVTDEQLRRGVQFLSAKAEDPLTFEAAPALR